MSRAARARSLLFYSILPLLSTCLQQIGKAVESNSLLFLCLFPLMTVGSALLASRYPSCLLSSSLFGHCRCRDVAVSVLQYM